MAYLEQLHVGNLVFDSLKDRAGNPVGGGTPIDLDELTQNVQSNLDIPTLAQAVGNGLDIPALAADVQIQLDIPAIIAGVEAGLDISAITKKFHYLTASQLKTHTWVLGEVVEVTDYPFRPQYAYLEQVPDEVHLFGMPKKYFDFSASTNGNGTLNSPFNTVDAAVWTPGTNHVFKSLTTFAGTSSTRALLLNVGGTGPEIYNRVVITTSSVGKATISGGVSRRGIEIANNLAYFYLQNIRVTNITTGADRRGLINQNTGASPVTNSFITLKNCEFDDVQWDNATDCNGIKIYGKGNKIIDCQIHNIATDGIWYHGDDMEISGTKIYEIAKDGRDAGDCIQMGGTSINSIIRNNDLDHSNNDGKQCYYSNSPTATGLIFENNRCVGFKNSVNAHVPVYIASAGAIVRNNILYYGAVCLTLTSTSTNSQCYQNIVVNQGAGRGIDVTSAGTKVLFNTAIADAASTAIGIRNSAATTGIEIRSNIVSGFVTGVNHAAGSTESNNVFSNVTTAVSGAGTSGGSNVITKVEFNEDFSPKPNALITGKGTRSVLEFDSAGVLRLFNGTPGALEPKGNIGFESSDETLASAGTLLDTDVVRLYRNGLYKYTLADLYDYVNGAGASTPFIDVAKFFNLLPDTNQNQRSQLDDVIDELSEVDTDGKGGRLLLNQGVYKFGGTTRIEFKKRFSLEGLGPRSTVIAPFTGFSASHFIQLGADAAPNYGFDNYIKNLKVDLNGFNTIGVRGFAVQEGCGVFNCLIANCSNKGIVFDGGGNSNFKLENIEVYKKEGTAATQGILISTTGGKVTLKNATVIGFTTAWAEACVKVEATQIDIDGLHMEGGVDGLLVAGNNALVSANNISGPFTGSNGITNLIHVAGEMKSKFVNIQKRSATNAYVNDFENTTLIDSSIAEILATKSSGSPTYLSNGTRIFGVGGNPDGAVDGEPGSVAHRKNATKGTTLYVKESAKGTLTGWTSVTPLVNTEAKTWGVIAANARPTENVTVSGAAVGDRAQATMNIVLGGVRLFAEVTAANVVTVTAENPTGSSITLGAGTITVFVYS